MRPSLPSAALLLAWVVPFTPALSATAQAVPKVTSTLHTIAPAATEGTPEAAYTAPTQFEAPNWTHDGKSLIFDQAGQLFRVPVAGGTPERIPTGDLTHCNGSHGVSPDGSLLAVSCSSPTLPESHVYVVPIAGGTPRLVTEHTQSYFHTWAPDGKTIVFTRPDHGASNFLAISLQGGPEKALTSGGAINDDPDFSPDGRFIYFNSNRGGSMQIWRMHPDGSGMEQLTSDDRVNWTPHPSPDGQWVVFLSYAPGTTGHPNNQPITLRLFSTKTHAITTLVHLTGGGGTMNTPCWAPDSHRLAFVSYAVPAN